MGLDKGVSPALETTPVVRDLEGYSQSFLLPTPGPDPHLVGCGPKTAVTDPLGSL